MITERRGCIVLSGSCQLSYYTCWLCSTACLNVLAAAQGTRDRVVLRQKTGRWAEATFAVVNVIGIGKQTTPTHNEDNKNNGQVYIHWGQGKHPEIIIGV